MQFHKTQSLRQNKPREIVEISSRSKIFEEVKVGLYKKEKQEDHVEEMSCYVDSNRNIAVLLDSQALVNERNAKRQNGGATLSISSTLYFKQAKHFMKKKQYEKALSYLQTAIGLSGTDDSMAEDGQGE